MEMSPEEEHHSWPDAEWIAACTDLKLTHQTNTVSSSGSTKQTNHQK